MLNNLERYKSDLTRLITRGGDLFNSIQYEAVPENFRKAGLDVLGDQSKLDRFIEKLPNFSGEYQNWYSEAQSVVKQLLPNRYIDFTRLYDKPKGRKDITNENYMISDYLQGITVSRGGRIIVGSSAAIPQFQQQLNILKSVSARFESSLFDIKQLVQADLFDSELDAARELLKNKFTRAAGAMAGVVLERHLQQVCDNHNITVAKKHPSISDLNEVLKASSVIDVVQWRFIQHLGDLRNNCDHNKAKEPTSEDVGDLIDGVEKIVKTIF